MERRDWTMTLGDGRVFTQMQWLELRKEERQRLLVESKPIAVFRYI